MNELATKQDLYNIGVDMDAKFDKAQVALNKTLNKFGALFFTMMIAILSIDRWWR